MRLLTKSTYKSSIHIAYRLAVFLAVTTNVLAQSTTAPGTIVQVNTEWNADQIIIATTAPFVNPMNCVNTDGYVSEISQNGYKTHYQAVLLAFALDKPVNVVVSNTECTSVRRPKIIGVYVNK